MTWLTQRRDVIYFFGCVWDRKIMAGENTGGGFSARSTNSDLAGEAEGNIWIEKERKVQTYQKCRMWSQEQKLFDKEVSYIVCYRVCSFCSLWATVNVMRGRKKSDLIVCRYIQISSPSKLISRRSSFSFKSKSSVTRGRASVQIQMQILINKYRFTFQF